MNAILFFWFTREYRGNDVDRRSIISHAASFPIKDTIDQPRFQSNIPLNRWYISSIFQIWSAPVGYI